MVASAGREGSKEERGEEVDWSNRCCLKHPPPDRKQVNFAGPPETRWKIHFCWGTIIPQGARNRRSWKKKPSRGLAGGLTITTPSSPSPPLLLLLLPGRLMDDRDTFLPEHLPDPSPI